MVGVVLPVVVVGRRGPLSFHPCSVFWGVKRKNFVSNKMSLKRKNFCLKMGVKRKNLSQNGSVNA